MQHVKAIVVTQPGERVMLPDYGIPLPRYVFSPGPDQVSQEITLDVIQQIGQWEPSVNVINVTPSGNDTGGVSNVDVEFSYDPSADSNLNTAVVEVGGTVITQAPSSDQLT